MSTTFATVNATVAAVSFATSSAPRNVNPATSKRRDRRVKDLHRDGWAARGDQVVALVKCAAPATVQLDPDGAAAAREPGKPRS